MLIYVIADRPSKIASLRSIVEPRHRVIAPDPTGVGAKPGPDAVVLLDLDLRRTPMIDQARAYLRNVDKRSHKIFVIDRNSHGQVVQAHALGGTGTIHRPIDGCELLHALSLLEAPGKPARLDAGSPALSHSAAIFASMFSAMIDGTAIVLGDAKQATDQIIDSIHTHGLSAWLDDVRKYHEGTFQHCLLVSGIAVSFGLSLGFCNADVRRLGLAATLHDVGKAKIPLAILDKPDRLDAGEEKTMRQHPLLGFDALKPIAGLDAETLDAVRHHHEYLDGTGYPDGLRAPAISDVVRLLTISDIFAALIEARPYRPPMNPQRAYDILCEMDGKLESALIRAFKPIALSA